MNTLIDLVPYECLAIIFMYAGYSPVLKSFCLVKKDFKNLSERNDVWYVLFQHQFGILPFDDIVPESVRKPLILPQTHWRDLFRHFYKMVNRIRAKEMMQKLWWCCRFYVGAKLKIDKYTWSQFDNPNTKPSSNDLEERAKNQKIVEGKSYLIKKDTKYIDEKFLGYPVCFNLIKKFTETVQNNIVLSSDPADAHPNMPQRVINKKVNEKFELLVADIQRCIPRRVKYQNIGIWEGQVVEGVPDGEGVLTKTEGMWEYTLFQGVLKPDGFHSGVVNIFDDKSKKHQDDCKKCVIKINVKQLNRFKTYKWFIDRKQFVLHAEGIGPTRKYNQFEMDHGKLYNKDGLLWYEGSFTSIFNQRSEYPSHRHGRDCREIYYWKRVSDGTFLKDKYEEYIGSFRFGYRQDHAGELRVFNKKGELMGKYIGEFHSGLPHGDGMVFDRNGDLRFKGAFVHGQRAGSRDKNVQKEIMLFGDGNELFIL